MTFVACSMASILSPYAVAMPEAMAKETKVSVAAAGPRDLIGPRMEQVDEKPKKGNGKEGNKDKDGKGGRKNKQGNGQSGKATGNGEASSDGAITQEVPSFVAKHMLWDDYAHDDGSINEWADGWYNAHNWSEPGKAIVSLGIGDVIIIDGIPITITDRFYCDVDDYYERIRTEVGEWSVIFQTCLGDGAHNIILTGRSPQLGPFQMPEAPTQQVTTTTITYEVVEETTSQEWYEEDSFAYPETQFEDPRNDEEYIPETTETNEEYIPETTETDCEEQDYSVEYESLPYSVEYTEEIPESLLLE